MLQNAASIMPGSKFASKPNLPHGISGIFISSGSKIGRNAVIFHQVTIGSVTTLDSKRHGSPIIGDNCYIGAGAKIIGRIRVGNNVRIGANAVVYKDVPDNSVVTNGEQITITKKERQVNTYYFSRKGRWHFAQDGKFIQCPENGKKPVV
ncbi:serine acetyltransferase [Francisella philomiragia]|uniref:serine acetyltransferase n=1 Tax=Francisella philomiragia TaxID=28110 RepID=UPI003510D545